MAIFKKKRTVEDKVEYSVNDKWMVGVNHGKRTYETPDGRVTKTTYIIDTGNKNEVDPEQPELIEVDESLVRPAKK